MKPKFPRRLIGRAVAPLLLLGLFSNLPAAAAGPTAPNILWIITDDQRLDSIGAFNRMRRGQDASPLGRVMSPNVDRLAALGTTFINTFNQNPSCAPSRTVMHTGRYSHRTGVYGFEYYNPVGQANWRPLVPEILRDVAGYQTLTVGKLGIRAQHFGGKKGGTLPPLYQVDLGYRKEFAAKGLVDWNPETKWVGGKPGPKNEFFFLPDGRKLVWPEDAAASPNDRAEIRRRLDLFRDYRPGSGMAAADEEGGADGEILGGVNPQPGDKTRDGSFVAAVLEYLTHPDTSYTDLLGNKLAGPKGTQPLFIHCGFETPHTPVLPPEEFRRKFREFTYLVPKFAPEELAGFPPSIQKLYRMAASDHFTAAEKQQMIRDYFAFCAYGDSQVGKLVDGFIAYSEKQHRPWLVLYVCGDNGWRLNEHGMIKKFALFDTDLRNPIIVVSSDKQRFPAGKVVTDFAGFVDMAPAFLSAAGIDVSRSDYKYLDGRDLARVAAGTVPARDYIIAEPDWVIGPCALIRTKDYKFFMKVRPQNGNAVTAASAGKNPQWALTAELKDVGPMLFDLRVDPEETNNLSFDPYYRPVLDALRTKLQNIVLGDGRVEVAWSKAGGDRVFESNFSPGADDGKLTLPILKPRGL